MAISTRFHEFDQSGWWFSFSAIEGDPGHEPERLAEVGELERSVQLAVDDVPAGDIGIGDQSHGGPLVAQ